MGEEWQNMQHSKQGLSTPSPHQYEGDHLLPQGLPSDADVPRFNCSSSDAKTPDRWPSAKKAWCCLLEGVGCSTTTEEAPYTCDGHAGAWGRIQRNWCCSHRGLGCTTSPPTIVHKPFDCNIHEREWGVDQKEWCCKHEAIGCRGCQAECMIEGVGAPCWNYIQWMA